MVASSKAEVEQPRYLFRCGRKARTLQRPRAVDALIEWHLRRLKWDDLRSRLDAASSLGRYKDPRSINALIDVLNAEESNDSAKQHAAESLGKIGDPSALEPLIATALRHGMDCRWAAMRALGEIGDVRAAAPLVKALAYSLAPVERRELELALRRFGANASSQPLIEALRGPDATSRRRAAEILHNLGWVPNSLQDRVSSAILRGSFEELVREGEDGVQPLLDALEAGLHSDEGDQLLCNKVTKALGKTRSSRVVRRLTELLLRAGPASLTIAIDAVGALCEILGADRTGFIASADLQLILQLPQVVYQMRFVSPYWRNGDPAPVDCAPLKTLASRLLSSRNPKLAFGTDSPH